MFVSQFIPSSFLHSRTSLHLPNPFLVDPRRLSSSLTSELPSGRSIIHGRQRPSEPRLLWNPHFIPSFFQASLSSSFSSFCLPSPRRQAASPTLAWFVTLKLFHQRLCNRPILKIEPYPWTQRQPITTDYVMLPHIINRSWSVENLLIK
jgi:hypothetical protein